MIKRLIVLSLFLCNHINLHAVVASGDPEAATGTTFSFSVGSAAYDVYNQRLWTFTGQSTSSFSTSVQSYGVSYTPLISVDGYLNAPLIAYPFLTTQAFITTLVDGNFNITSNPITNPLLENALGATCLYGSNVLVVPSSTPRFIYFLQTATFVDGASGKNAPDGISIINELDLGLAYQAVALRAAENSAIFIANSQGPFSSVNPCYISFAVTTNNFATINDVNTTCVTLAKQADEPITTTSSVLTAGGGAIASFNSQVAMYPSPVNSVQVYVGLDVTAGSLSGDQAVGMFTATAQLPAQDVTPTITLGSVLPDAVAQQGLQTPVSATRGLRVAVADITTTATSTGLSYIISSRYNGAGQQFVYAMPMVTMSSTSSNNGMIADFDSIAQNFQIIGVTYRTQGFDQVITDASQIDIASADPLVIDRLRIGGGAVPLAADQFIDQLTAQGDAVYITIQTAFASGSTPGMFKSQALFDAQGRIQSWTPWQRVAGTDDQMLFSIKDRSTGATMYVSGASSNTVQQTIWNNTTDLTTFIDDLTTTLATGIGGIQSIIPVSPQTTDLTGVPLVIGMGNSAAVIAQTGQLNIYNEIVMTDPQTVVTLDASLGLNIGSVVAATFAHQSTSGNNWLFLGGNDGLAVLSNDGTGVGFNGELVTLNNLVLAGQSCKTLGDFKYIKKLVSYGDNLYVLTTNAVYQIALDATKFTLTSPASLNAQVVVQAASTGQFSYCLDMLVDNNIMLLGTTAGLYQLNVGGSLPATPVAITIPGGLSAVSKLTTVSTSGVNDQDFYTSSNLYVLTINFALQQACLNRFTITEGVIQPIQDQLLQGVDGPLLEFAFMNNNIFIDGSFGFATVYKIGDLPAAVKYMQYTLQAGKSSAQIGLKAYTTDISLQAVLYALGIAGVTRDYASGCLMLAGSFGLLTDS